MWYLTSHPHVCRLPPVAWFVAYILPDSGTDFLRDLHTAEEAVQDGTTQDAIHKRVYWQWAEFYATLLVNPVIQDSSIPRIKLIQVYGHRVWHANYSKRHIT